MLVDLVDARADPDQRIGCGVEDDEAVVGLGRCAKEVVAQAELQLQVPSGGDAVLNEGAERLGEEVVGSIAERDVERIAQPGLKRGNARIGKGASIQVEAGMLAPPNLPTELDDVIPA